MPRLLHREDDEPWVLPHLGQRIVKTTVAVFLCLLFYYLRGYRGQDMPTEAAITAILCMQPYVRDTGAYALNRFVGTLIGAFWGLLLLLLLNDFPSLGASVLLLYAMMAVGVLLSLYSAVLVRTPDASGLASIVFLCIVISFPDVEAPLRQAAHRILGVFVGTAVATAVNVFRLPRRKRPEQVFFLRMKDLAPDRFTHLSGTALMQLNYLYGDGAKICLMSEHAPAFFALQMSGVKLSAPLIVMDGAAVYDANENRYLQALTIPPEDSAPVRERLAALGVSFFIYTIHNDKACVFHNGEYREEERVVLERMRRSPYRSYLEGEIYDPAEIVYLKIIAPYGRIEEIEHSLRAVLPRGRLRRVVRPQQGGDDLAALYIYAHGATMEQAQRRLMETLREEEPSLVPVSVRLRAPYRSERDAIHLLHLVGSAYEPLFFAPKQYRREIVG
ncbi:MAG: FUSC family protein [Oscillospiraceae bacterium]|nr:FUSC family protein [Oscillospiraceae bacterium]